MKMMKKLIVPACVFAGLTMGVQCGPMTALRSAKAKLAAWRDQYRHIELTVDNQGSQINLTKKRAAQLDEIIRVAIDKCKEEALFRMGLKENAEYIWVLDLSEKNLTNNELSLILYSLLSKEEFSGIAEKIQQLNLSFNQLEYLPETLTATFCNVSKLDVHYNKLQTIPTTFCFPDSKLRTLCLDPRQIKTIRKSFKISNDLPDCALFDMLSSLECIMVMHKKEILNAFSKHAPIIDQEIAQENEREMTKEQDLQEPQDEPATQEKINVA